MRTSRADDTLPSAVAAYGTEVFSVTTVTKVVRKFSSSTASRSASKRLGMIALGVVVASGMSAPAFASAAPVDDIAGALGGLANSLLSDSGLPSSSSELGLGDIIPKVPSPGNGTSRCTSVVQVGDSTSVNADKASALPSPSDTASAQYRRVGATSVKVDALSGRAVVGGPGTDAEKAVAGLLSSGSKGCWVIAMGINDAGAISSGSTVSADARIDRIMSALKGQPVLWPTVTTSNPKNQAFGPAAMATFNTALRAALARYPNLAVYDWAGSAPANEFASDGIHYTAAGTADRNRRFADALARAYPQGVAGYLPASRWITG